MNVRTAGVPNRHQIIVSATPAGCTAGAGELAHRQRGAALTANFDVRDAAGARLEYSLTNRTTQPRWVRKRHCCGLGDPISAPGVINW